MKRFRVLSFHFDSTANLVSREISPSRGQEVQDIWRSNQKKMIAGLKMQYGEGNFEIKLQNLIDIGSLPFSILAYHNKILAQSRESFVIGSYFPALTSICTLGEIILNRLLFDLKDYYKQSEHYKRIYRRKSVNNWSTAISILDDWNIFTERVRELFESLLLLRNRAVHDYKSAEDDRELALEAMKIINDIVAKQFGGFGPHSWFIPNIRGASFIKKEAEMDPFIKTVYLPNCLLVGPEHQLELRDGRWRVRDRDDYPETEIADSEFATLFEKRRQ